MVIGAPLATGLLGSGKGPPCRYGHPATPDDPDVQAALRLRRWAADRGVSLPALALQWILRNPRVGVVIAGGVSAAEVEENVRAVTAPLPLGLWEEWEKTGLKDEG